MSKLTRREIGSHDRGTLDDRLARLLDSPRLARVVPALAPEALHRIVRHVGLDASAELVAAATPSQLTSLLDLDLWRQQAHGRDATFDADRFGDWLEALVDAGDGLAARVVASLDPQVVIAGLCRYVRVFDPGTFEPTAQSDDELPDRHELMNSETSGDLPEIEVGGYLVRARRTDAWDAVTVLLVALESGHTDCFHALMRGCRRLSNSTPEVEGLDDLLLAPAQHLHDTSVARDLGARGRDMRPPPTPGRSSGWRARVIRTATIR